MKTKNILIIIGIILLSIAVFIIILKLTKNFSLPFSTINTPSPSGDSGFGGGGIS